MPCVFSVSMGLIPISFAILAFTVCSQTESAFARLKMTALPSRRIATAPLTQNIVQPRAVVAPNSVPLALRMAPPGPLAFPMGMSPHQPVGMSPQQPLLGAPGPSPSGASSMSPISGIGGATSPSPIRPVAPMISQPVAAPSVPVRGRGRSQTDLASLPPPRIEQINPETRGAFGALRDLANQHINGCGSARVSNRGAVAKVPGYFYGVTNSFARSICRGAQDPVRVSMGGSKSKMIWNYARVTALGMYESSGGRDIGMDVTNRSSNKADTAEAGIWQTSNNVRRGLSSYSRAALENMEREYERNPDACMQGIYREGLGRYRDGGIIGSGAGARFQAMQKRCPALAAETTAITSLNVPRHYGPLVRGEARAIPRCEHLFRDVAELVERNPTMCTALAVSPSYNTPGPVQVAEARK